MAQRSITVRLDADLVAQAEALAARRNTSLSDLVAGALAELAATDRAEAAEHHPSTARYERARRHALRSMDEAIERGGISWRREDLHDR